MQEDAAVKAIQKEIDETIAQEDPILAESVSAEINDHLAISYPFYLQKRRQKHGWQATLKIIVGYLKKKNSQKQ